MRSGKSSKSVLAEMQRFLLKNLKKKNIALAAIVLGLSLSIPFMFATAANDNEVSQAAFIQGQAVTPNPTVPVQNTPQPASTDGVLVSDLAEGAVQPSATPTSTALTFDASTVSATPVVSTDGAYSEISPGMDDPFVAMIQQRLMDLGYMDQDDPTTLFGPITSQAITEFQRKNGLSPDGVAGVQTQTELFSNNAKPYIVTEGDSGPDVQSIQERLAELGYAVGNTGYFGTDTTKAVQYFQRMNGLTPDGNVGDDTRQALYSQNAEPSLEYTAAKEAASQKSSAGKSSSSNVGGNNSAGNKATGTPAPAAPPAQPANSSKVEAFINAALAELGKTYVLGGKGPNVFDCSGLVYFALKASGNGIPYMTSYGWGGAGQYARISSMKDLQRGDVVCERGHVGIYLGNGQIVNASSSNGKVIISNNVFNSSYWVGHFVCGRRPL